MFGTVTLAADLYDDVFFRLLAKQHYGRRGKRQDKGNEPGTKLHGANLQKLGYGQQFPTYEKRSPTG